MSHLGLIASCIAGAAIAAVPADLVTRWVVLPCVSYIISHFTATPQCSHSPSSSIGDGGIALLKRLRMCLALFVTFFSFTPSVVYLSPPAFSLPGYGAPKTATYSGYLAIAGNKNLHYIFYESKRMCHRLRQLNPSLRGRACGH